MVLQTGKTIVEKRQKRKKKFRKIYPLFAGFEPPSEEERLALTENFVLGGQKSDLKERYLRMKSCDCEE